ncbi:AraC family transcriptional regulator [Ideonella sp. DXS22W]|uniref:AraC family transcriptional regulator n=1 Tax=Pseudaquabacterium inlustre TaxID=2984192 RepID=A0ABU9CL98_9BURK
MQTSPCTAAATAPRRCTSADRLMWITPDRVLYVGLLGVPSVRTMGGIVAYVALDGDIQIRTEQGDGGLDGAWQRTQLAVVQPYVRHQVACDTRHIAVLKVEPESVDLAQLPPLLRAPSGAVDDAAFVAHVRACHARLASAGRNLDLQLEDFDHLLFGRALAPRQIDPRIAAVLERIKRDPAAPAMAEEFAVQARLSFSRFLHLFKQEVGAPFRSFRTWKRARSLLHYVNRETNLAHVALDAGYPDSTHFSHSIRQVYGLKPRDIFAGSRKLRVIDPLPPRDGQRLGF